MITIYQKQDFSERIEKGDNKSIVYLKNKLKSVISLIYINKN